MAGRIDSGREFPWRMICIILSLILGIAANVFILVIYGKTLLKAEEYANKQEFSTAYDYMLIKPVNKLVNERLFSYVDAGVTMEHGNYDIAAPVFESLHGYKDSEKLYKKCAYKTALSCVETDPKKAAVIFSRLRDRSDTDKEWNELMYGKAEELMDGKKYSQAYTVFKELGYRSYKNSKYMADRCICQPYIDEYKQDSNYWKAIKKLTELGNEGNIAAEKEINRIKEEQYEIAVEYYRSKEKTGVAKSILNYLKPYKRSNDYLTLMDCRDSLSWIYSPVNSRQIASRLMELIGFEDAAMLLMKDHAVAWEYLQGKWYSYDGSYYIDCTSENFDSNFPGADKGQVLIEDGVMYFSEYEDMQDMLNWLRLTVKDKDQCEVYCFGENQKYLMYRE